MSDRTITRAKRDQYLAYRLRVLPEQLQAAERKVAALLNEAARYGMAELLEARP